MAALAAEITISLREVVASSRQRGASMRPFNDAEMRERAAKGGSAMSVCKCLLAGLAYAVWLLLVQLLLGRQ